MAGRFPDAPDLDAFWANLSAGRDSIGEISSRWDVAEHYDPDRKAPGRTYSKWAALLDDIDEFDAAFFRISPLEAESMDPQQRLFLQAAWTGIEDAGYAGAEGPRRWGVFVGCASGEYAGLLDDAGLGDSAHAFLGNSGSVLAARIAYLLDLTGPTMAIDTACSSSLVAVHLACEALRSGECEAAVAGGVALMLTPRMHILTSKAGMLSPSGLSAPFGAAADGIVLGEGCGAVVLKRLDQALADGDRVHGVILGNGVNGDGRTNGLTAPSAISQANLIGRVQERAGVSARDVTYIETHGTGTPLGDPLEVKALDQVLRAGGAERGGCAVGSVKGNIGHTTMAAGVAGLLKVLLALRHGSLPPTLNATETNPNLDLGQSPVRLVTQLEPWHPGPSGTRVAGISSFGFSGTNAHLVVTEPPRPAPGGAPQARAGQDDARAGYPVVLSARTQVALARTRSGLASRLADPADRPPLPDLAWTLATRRARFAIRDATVVRDYDELLAWLRGEDAGPAAGPGGPAGDATAAFLAGQPVDWTPVFDGRPGRVVTLPGYPFEQARYWAPAASADSERTGSQSESANSRVLDPRHWLVADHRVSGVPLLPAVAALELAAGSADGLPVRVTAVQWLRPVEVSQPRSLRLSIAPDGRFTLPGAEDGAPAVRGRIARPAGTAEEVLPAETVDLAAIRARCPGQLAGSRLYPEFAAAGIEYGPSYQVIGEVRYGQDEALAALAAPAPRAAEIPGRPAHPVMLDAALQAVAALGAAAGSGPLLPFALAAFELLGPVPAVGYSHVSREGSSYTVRLTDDGGQVRARFSGLALRPAPGGREQAPPAAELSDGLIFVPAFEPAAPAATAAPRRRGHVAIVHHPGGAELATALAAEHRRTGDKAATVRWGAPIGTAQTLYLLPDDGSGDAEKITVAAFRVLRELAEARGRQPLQVKIVTAGTAGTGAGPARSDTAGVTGLARSAAAECPAWTVSCLDVPAEPGDPSAIAAQLTRDPGTERVVAYRDGQRLVRVLRPLATASAPDRRPYRNGGVYLIVGGGGGIGGLLARHLARTERASVVLTGRRAAGPETEELLADIRRLGGRASYLRADVSEEDALRSAVRHAKSEFGALHGVFHAALVLRDRSLVRMDEELLTDVLRPKLAGAQVLGQVLCDEQLDFLVFFSSAVSFTDSGGQANYAAASTFEDALAHQLRQRCRFPVSVVNWGFWGSVGAVADERHVSRMAGLGVGSIEPAQGLAALAELLRRDVPQALVVKANADGLARLGAGTDSVSQTRAAFADLERLGPALLRHAAGGATRPPHWAVTPAMTGLAEAVSELLASPGGELTAAGLADRHPELAAHAELLDRCVAALPGVLDGTVRGTEVLFPRGSAELVERVYHGLAAADFYHQLLADEVTAAARRAGRPVRVLEIGAGTGASSRFVLDACASAGAAAEYWYTDVSRAFLQRGQDAFAARFPFLRFAPLDIERNPAEQGFDPYSYDVVLATNVLHATRRIDETLAWARTLLRDGGTLLVNEVTRTSGFATLTFGLTPGWWRFEDPAVRLPLSPLLSPAQWRRTMSGAGFAPVRTLGFPGTAPDDLEQCVFAATAVSRPAGQAETAAGATAPPLPSPASFAGAVPVSVPAAEPAPAGAARDYVRQVFAEVLRFSPADLDDAVTFDNYGVDSLVSLDIVARFEADLGPLPSTLLFEYLTVAQLADHLAAEHADRLGAALAGQAAPSPAAPPTPAITSPAPPQPQPPNQADEIAIAVVGVAGRYPGAADVDDFWRLLADGRSGISEVPEDRWDWRQHASAGGAGRWGGFLPGVDQFDPAFFGILPRDAADIDPQERLFLEVAWQLLEQAGYLGKTTREQRTGVFAGTMYGSYGQLAATGWGSGKLSGAHSAYWSIANRVSYVLDLHGPSFAVDSACSSSLLAVHLASESIRRGECAMAIAGGVNVILHPAHFASLGALNMLSADGRCKVFDAAADGFVPGEGVGAVLLKPLAAAEADGDQIWAVIRGSLANAGGKTGGYTVPNPNAQGELVSRALASAGIDPATVGYLEAHGTGTELGDPIELAGLRRGFGVSAGGPAAGEAGSRCAVGSVKANVGHLEGAAGIAGLTRVLLQLRNGQLAPCVNLDTLNPKIDLGSRFYLPRTLEPWPALAGEDGRPQPRRAGVSSFGAGGANVHVLLEEHRAAAPAPRPTGRELLFPLSARSLSALSRYAAKVGHYLAGHPELRLDELCHTAQLGRAEFAERLVIVAADTAQLSRRLLDYAAGRFPVDTETAGLDNTDPEASAVAREWSAGGPADWERLWPGPRPRHAIFPGCPMERSRYWLSLLDPGLAPATPAEPAQPTVAPPDAGLTTCRYLRPRWRPVPAEASGPIPARTLLVSADAALAAEMARHIPAVTVAVPGERFDPASDADCDRLAAELADAGPLPEALVFLFPADGQDLVRDPGLYAFVRLGTAILRHRPAGLRALAACTGGLAGPAAAGAIRTLAQEHRGFTGACVTVEGPPAAVAAQLAAELTVGGEHTEVRYDHGQRLVRELAEFDPPEPAAPVVRRGGSYLITGGAGGLGLLFAGYLAKAGAARVTLAGRSELSAERTARLTALSASGTRVEYRRADVGSTADVVRLVAACGPLHGVIHAAGVTRDRRTADKPRAEMAEVLAAKVTGAVALDAATRDLPLDFFVLFSSAAAAAGNPGQADYCMANAFLDAFAAEREARRLRGARPGRTVSFGWPLWADGGMTVDEPTRRLFARVFGMVPMPTGHGLAAFERGLASAEPVVVVVEQAPAGPAEADQSYRTQAADPVPVALLREHAEAELRRLASAFLLVDPAEVTLTDDLMEIGFDSISLTELVNAVNEIFDLDLLPTAVFESATLGGFAGYLAEQHGDAVARAVRPAGPADSTATDPVPMPAPAPQPAQNPAPAASSRTPVADQAGAAVAVIGMAGMFPGSPDLATFWDHLAAGADLTGPVPSDRRELLAHPDTAGTRAGFLADVAGFDAARFRISATEAALMDPQQRLFLQAAWRAVEDAGYQPSELAGSDTGLFVGVSTTDYADLLRENGHPVEAHTASGIAHSILANRVSHVLDLHGPSEAVDTACSSALVALHRAVRSLAAGDCSAALVGGVNVLLSPGLFTAFGKSGMLSADGTCKVFDAAADGYVRGEGVGALLLKPLAAALADGDRVHAVIRGTAVNHGGRAPSLTAPSPEAQARVLVRAYREAGIDPATVTAIEAHGTGTRLGDPVEVEGMKKAFAELYAGYGRPAPDRPHIAIGSVKSNIGHLEAAAGAAGLIKMVLAMRHRQLPATVHFHELNPYLRLTGTPFYVNAEARPWAGIPDGGRLVRRAGVSSFGFGGTNAHVVIESWDGLADAGQRRPLPGEPFATRAYWFDGRADQPETTKVTEAVVQPSANSIPESGGRHRGAKVVLAPVAAAGPQPGATAPAGVSGHPAAAPAARTPVAATAGNPVQAPAPVAAPVPAPAVPALGEVRGRVRDEAAQILGLAATELADDAPFTDLGLDSIFRMDLARRLSAHYEIALQGAELYDHDTVELLAAHLVRSVADQSGPLPEAPAPQAPAPLPVADDTTADDTTADETTAELLGQLVEAVTGRPLTDDALFTDGGLSSFDMLRVVSALERRFGALRKTLLFDFPTVLELAEHLAAEHGGQQAAAALAAVLADGPDTDPDAGIRMDEVPRPPAGDGQQPLIVRKRLLADDDETQQVLRRIDAQHAKEGGLAGRDIAPLAFIGAGGRAYFNFSRRDRDMLAWSYAGSEEDFPVLAGQWLRYAAEHGLRASFLSMLPLAEVDGTAVTTTPFGAVQRLEDLGGFSLAGSKMARLRYMVQRFDRAGAASTVEYQPGTDPATDAEIVSLITAWGEQKQMVNPYVAIVREELSGGNLAGRHRMFLTRLDGRLVSAIIITKIPSEAGYLLDLEFYPGDMPLGGLEHAIVRILEQLRDEGYPLFSFGASFGVKLCDSPNASPEAEQGLAELRAAGIFGEGNFKFKNKFRPVNRAIYLCQAAVGATPVADVILMIANPDIGADVPGQATPAQQASPVREQPVRAQPAVEQRAGQDRAADAAGRAAKLAASGYNPLLLAHSEVETDLLTDSWAELANTAITEREDRLRTLAALLPDFAAPAWLPFDHVIPMPSGRSAEALLGRCWPGRRGVVLHNGLFPTWIMTLLDNGFAPERLPVAGSGEFGGDIDITAFRDRLAANNGGTAFTAVELSGNAGGGLPVSLGRLRAIQEAAAVHHVPLVLDATRLLENAACIAAREPGWQGADLWQVARELLSLADAVTFSLSKDFGVSFGGLVATSRPELATRIAEHTALRGQEVGLTARRMLGAALADTEAVAELVAERMAAVRALWSVLSQAGLPVAGPPGGHCVLLDAGQLPGAADLADPVASTLAWLYTEAGLRGGPHLAGGPDSTLIRLAVPLGLSAAAAAAGGLAGRAWRSTGTLPDLLPVDKQAAGGRRPLARYHPAAALPGDIGQAMREGHRPENGNAEVLREYCPAVHQDLFPVPGGQAEVFSAGDGPTVVLMHPFNIGAGVFARQYAALADRYRLVSVHHPGVGGTTAGDDLSLDGIADLVAAVLDRLGGTEPAHVVGASFGGLIAQSFALRYPERTATLTLIGSSFKVGNRRGEVNRLSVVAAEDFNRIAAREPDGPATRQRAEFERLLLRCESMDPRLGLSYLDVFAAQPTLLPRLPDIEVPTLVLHGALDTVIPLKVAHLLHGSIPDVTYTELAGAGHFPCLTHAEEVHAALLPFITAHSEQPARQGR
jgi:acyl transferase domain-containing protein/tryptophanase/pimeloyl-ACP methyl ester carboxylesterase/acyl carrier protein/SAM-dependent methyltransferase